jgi:PAS domain-containing protein
VYLWLDEETMACNEALAELFGCTVEEWCGTEDFLGDYVDPKDHELFGESFERAIGRLEGPVRFRFTGLRKDGSKVKLETDMIPLTFAGHAVAYHFVRKA